MRVVLQRSTTPGYYTQIVCSSKTAGSEQAAQSKGASPVAATPEGRSEMASILVGAADQEIAELESRLRSAQLAADVAALDNLIADELLFTGPTGEIATKAQDIDAHRSGALRFRQHEPLELRVRRIGRDVAITALRARLAVDVEGRAVRGTYRYTRVWARDSSGSWQVVGGHVSEVSESP
jgi:ketosteroid isomerase-like protein